MRLRRGAEEHHIHEPLRAVDIGVVGTEEQIAEVEEEREDLHEDNALQGRKSLLARNSGEPEHDEIAADRNRPDESAVE